MSLCCVVAAPGKTAAPKPPHMSALACATPLQAAPAPAPVGNGTAAVEAVWSNITVANNYGPSVSGSGYSMVTLTCTDGAGTMQVTSATFKGTTCTDAGALSKVTALCGGQSEWAGSAGDVHAAVVASLSPCSAEC